jgi:hypothetical protein
MKSNRYVLSTIKYMLSYLHEVRFDGLKETENIIITPEIKKLRVRAVNLTKAIYTNYKSINTTQDER